jgi:lipopolysaccharide assembly outer membrane protein LptD (OstA)
MKMFSCVVVVALIATVSPLAAQTSPVSQLGIEQSKQWSVKADGDAWLLRGDVELKIGTATIYADEADFPKGGFEMKLRGNVRITVSPLPAIAADRVERLATDGVEYRGKVRVVLDANGAVILADGADYSGAGNDLRLLGNVLFKKAPVPAAKR